MFETGIRQFRMAMSMVWGNHINPRNLERLVRDAIKTLEEFGAPGDDVQQLLEGPFSDPKARREFQNRSLQHTARRLARFSPYYKRLFAEHQINPEKITIETMPDVPVTIKRALQEQQRDFICADVQPYLTTRTTGTTGHPAEIWLSKYEIELWPAMSALSGLLRGEVSPQDCLQINLSSRATAAVQMNINMCRLVGAKTRVLGVIPPEESLDALLGSNGATMLTTYPSYLAQLVLAARKRGLGPGDFRLRRLECGGEVLSTSVARAAQETFGVKIIGDNFAMTEILPVSARACSQGHLHHDLNTGFVEVIDLENGKPAETGALGTLVVTTYYPYRECMPVFRYDTRDVVRQLAGEKLTCELAGMPATSHILGKADHLLRVNGQVVTMRDLVEICESLPSHHWPARFSAQVVDKVDGQQSEQIISMVLPAQALEGMSRDEIEQHFRTAGIPVRLAEHAAPDYETQRLRPLRADLLEHTFAARRN